MRLLLNFSFKNPRGENTTDWVCLNRDCDKQWVSYSPWIGTAPSGETQNVNDFGGAKAIYMKEGNSVIALVRGIATKDIMINIGDTGTGKLYAGMIPYPSPIEFTWECMGVGDLAAKAQAAPANSANAGPNDSVYIRPFTRP